MGEKHKLMFINTHLDHPQSKQAEENRKNSAKQIGQVINQHGVPAIVLLDSNAEPGALAHTKFLEMGLMDSWAECHPDAAIYRPTTFHLFRGTRFFVPPEWAHACAPESLGPDGRKTCHIDWFLHTPSLQSLACEIDRTDGKEGLSPPSDHFAVITTLKSV